MAGLLSAGRLARRLPRARRLGASPTEESHTASFATAAVPPCHERRGRPARPGGDLRHGAAGGDGPVVRKQRVGIALPGMLVAVLDQQPVHPLAGPALHADQHPAAMQVLAVQGELQVAGCQALLGRHALRRPGAAVPELDGAAAILAFRDGALEVAVVQRVVLHLDRQPLVMRVQRRAARDRPGLEHAVEFQPQVVVQPGRVVLLDDEAQLVGGGGRRRAARLGRPGEVALGLIDRKLACHRSPPSSTQAANGPHRPCRRFVRAGEPSSALPA